MQHYDKKIRFLNFFQKGGCKLMKGVVRYHLSPMISDKQMRC
jgi:hypothetical protein